MITDLNEQEPEEIQSQQTVPVQICQPDGQCVIKEIFCHTKIKLYPNGWVSIEMHGRSKDMVYQKKEKRSVETKKQEGVDEL